MKPLWGIDLGGTKVEGIVINYSPESYEVIERLRVPTEKHKGYDHIIGQIVKTVRLMEEKTNLHPDVIGVGTPGSTDPTTGLLKNSNTTALNGMPFKKDLKTALGLPLIMANDANCFAIAETKLGIVNEKMPDAQNVFGIIMGTGVGGGVVIHGKQIEGRHGIAGEWGHNYLDASGGKCYCGKIGCTETVISGPALERFYEQESGIKKPLKEIVSLQTQGEDLHAQKTMERLVHFFGIGVSNLINVLDPEVIVVGGGVGNIELLYNEGVKEVEKYVFNTRMDTVFLKPKLGDSAGVFGAALLPENT